MTTMSMPVGTQPAGPGDGFDHIVGDVQYWLDRLGVKTPRALCGESLAGEEPATHEGNGRPVCPMCAAKAGWRG